MTDTEQGDAVAHPPHYTSHPSGIECIQITEHMDFLTGNAIKYLWRAGLKSEDPIKDLEKAMWYIQRKIDLTRREDRKRRVQMWAASFEQIVKEAMKYDAYGK